MTKISVAGLQVDTVTKSELLHQIDQRLQRKDKTFVTTLYSEFLYAALQRRHIMRLLNTATFAVADGIAILWGQLFLSLPFKQKGYYAKIFEAWWHVAKTGAQIIFNPKIFYRTFPEKIVGADLIWDLAALAQRRQYSLYLLGGFGETPHTVASILRARFPGIQIVGASNKHPEDSTALAEINAVKPDMLLVAYGPLRQEAWIDKHRNQLDASLMIGLGGTFDYIAGTRTAPPLAIRAIGLEWLYRLFTQPHRWKRIKNATFDLVIMLVRYKVFMSLPLRRNAVIAVINDHSEILIARRKMDQRDAREYGYSADILKEYWQLPQGGLEATEDFINGAFREAREELGTDKLSALLMSERTHSYEWNNALRPFFSRTYRYRGQDQRVVYFKFTGGTGDIKIDNVEFTEYKWVPIDRLAASVHAERAPLAHIVVSDFKEGKPFEIKPK